MQVLYEALSLKTQQKIILALFVHLQPKGEVAIYSYVCSPLPAFLKL